MLGEELTRQVLKDKLEHWAWADLLPIEVQIRLWRTFFRKLPFLKPMGFKYEIKAGEIVNQDPLNFKSYSEIWMNA